MQRPINTAICLLIKDENDYINEWLEWHRSVGFQHFYIYDNGSKVPILDSVNELYKQFCTFVDFSGEHRNIQYDCYADALRRFGSCTKWMAFIDTDEFIRPVNGEDINEFLLDYEEYDGLYIRWVMYNANGLIKKDDRPQRERFTQTTDYIHTKPIGKSIIQTNKVRAMGPHFPIHGIGEYHMVDSNKKYMSNACVDFSLNDKIVVDHYFTRSYEEWIEKTLRGSCDAMCKRKYDEFFLFNPDMKILDDL